MTSQSVKQQFLELIRIVTRENSYLAKSIDQFLEIPVQFQRQFIEYMAKQLGRDQWNELAQDDTLYAKAIRWIVYHYTGNEEIDQPSRHDLGKMIASFIRTESLREN